MRTLLLTAVLGIVVTPGCNLRPCKKGTVLLTIKVDPSASAVDTFDVALSIDGGASQHSFINRKTGTNEGTVEIDFAQGYMAGAQLTVAVTGTSNGASIAFGTTTQTLAAGCQALTVTVGTSGAVKQVGDPAVPGDNCVTGHIVDGYCCEKACEGQCEACDDVPGKCQPVKGVPHGTRDACGGADVQAPCGPQTCDGVTTSACSWPTVQCGSPSCTAGMATPAAMCSGGTCQPATPKTCPSGICGATDCATVTQVAAGDLHTCALLSDGTLRCWGANEHGQLGLGANDATDRHAPTAVPGLTNVKQVVTGHQHTCALMGDGTVQCWGSNTFGALGRGDYDNTDPVIVHGAPQPVVSAVGGPSFGNVASLAAGPGGNAAHTCALLKDGEAWCWGLNSSGELGNGTTIFPMQGKGTSRSDGSLLDGHGMFNRRHLFTDRRRECEYVCAKCGWQHPVLGVQRFRTAGYRAERHDAASESRHSRGRQASRRWRGHRVHADARQQRQDEVLGRRLSRRRHGRDGRLDASDAPVRVRYCELSERHPRTTRERQSDLRGWRLRVRRPAWRGQVLGRKRQRPTWRWHFGRE